MMYDELQTFYSFFATRSTNNSKTTKGDENDTWEPKNY